MDVATLKNRHDELLKANYLWDERYSQLEREFDEYQKGATEAQRKASDYIYVLKDKVDVLQKEMSELKSQQSGYRSVGEERVLAAEQQMLAMRERLEQELRDVQHEARTTRMELDSLQIRCRELHVENSQLQEELQRLRQHGGGGGGGGGQRARQLQEDNEHLRHQATIYRDDFLAERRDREKMVDQLAQLKIKLDTETSSLRLQMDTLRREREKLRKDNTALMAQLSLKTARENQRMDNYFRGQGLVSRGTSGHLPPPAAGVAAAHSEPNSPRNSRPGSPQKILPTARSSGNLLMPSIGDERSRRPSDSGTYDLPPPFLGKGKHKCPRCYRKFEAKSELEDHKIRCLI